MLCIRDMHNTILCLCILLPPINHGAGLVLCIRDRCNTSVSLFIAASRMSVRVFVSGAIPVCVVVQFIVLPPIYHVAKLVMCIRGRGNSTLRLSTVCIRDRCNTILCLCTVFIAASNIYHDAGLVICIRDRCNTILCRCTVYITQQHLSAKVALR